MILGLRIKELREGKKISVTEFAESIGVVRQTVYDYESNKTEPSLDTLRKICATLEVSMADIFDNRTQFEFELNPAGGPPKVSGSQFKSVPTIKPPADSIGWYRQLVDEMREEKKRYLDIIDRLTGAPGKLFDVTLGGLANRENYTEAKVIEIGVANSVTSVGKTA